MAQQPPDDGFEPVEYAVWTYEPRFDGDREGVRDERDYLRTMARQTSGYKFRPNSWGYTIFRTAYGPGTDEQFARALVVIDSFVKFLLYHKEMCFIRSPMTKPENIPPDPIPRAEVVRRYSNVIIEDPSLDGISATQVAERFELWIKGRREEERPARPPLNTRYLTAMYLDQEALDSLSSAPDVPALETIEYAPRGVYEVYPGLALYREAKKYFVKIVELGPRGESRKLEVQQIIDYYFQRMSM